MRPTFSLLAALSAVVLILAPAQAEEATPAQELRDLRQAVQQQSKQIELLAEQVARLTRSLDSQKNREAAASTEPPKSTPEFAIDVPKAEAVNAGPRHVVVKGETLTSIAKQYNIPINELKTANKIENERKLQIGQVLILPAPKTPDTSDKKETP
jgi:LysM repeat protein